MGRPVWHCWTWGYSYPPALLCKGEFYALLTPTAIVELFSCPTRMISPNDFLFFCYRWTGCRWRLPIRDDAINHKTSLMPLLWAVRDTSSCDLSEDVILSREKNFVLVKMFFYPIQRRSEVTAGVSSRSVNILIECIYRTKRRYWISVFRKYAIYMRWSNGRLIVGRSSFHIWDLVNVKWKL